MELNTTIKNEIRELFDNLKEQHNLNWKDELQILGMLLDDLSVSMPAVPELTIRSTKK